MIESAKEMNGSVKVGGGNPKHVWWNNEVKLQSGKLRMLAYNIWSGGVWVQ